MKTSRLAIAIALIFLAHSSAGAQGTDNFDKGYPKAGTRQILVKGTVTPDNGWMTSGQNVIAYVWLDGMAQLDYQIPYNADKKTYGEIALDGLTSGKTYNVFVQAFVTDGVMTKFLNTASVRMKVN